MIRPRAFDIDNRDSSQMYEYLEARIEALKKRISELENENAALSVQLVAGETIDSRQFSLHV